MAENQYDKFFGADDSTGDIQHISPSPIPRTTDEGADQEEIARLIAAYLQKRPQAHTVNDLVYILKLAEVSIPNTPENRNHLWFLDEIQRLLDMLASENDQNDLVIPPEYVRQTTSLGRDRIHIQELVSASPLSTEKWLQANEHAVLAWNNSQTPYFQRTYYQLRGLQNLLTIKKAKDWMGTYDFKVLRKASIQRGTESKLNRAETAVRSRRIKALSMLIVSDDIDGHDEVAIDGIGNALYSIQQIVNRLLETMNIVIEKNSTDERFVAFSHLAELQLDEETLQDVHVDSLNKLGQDCGLSFEIPKHDREEARENYQAARVLVTKKIEHLREQEQLEVLQKGEQRSQQS